VPLDHLSPSQLEAFDERTPFGCERAWWWASAPLGPHKKFETEATLLGSALHKEIEHYLGRARDYNVLREDEAERRAKAMKMLEANISMVKVLQHMYGFAGFEAEHEMELEGVKIVMRIDILLGTGGWVTGVCDWKTSSNIEQYAKTAKQLREGIQMVLYAKLLTEKMPKVTWPFKIVHGYFQTKKELTSRSVNTEITKQQLEDRIDNDIVPLIRRMKAAAEVSDVAQLKPSLQKCNRCTYRADCEALKRKPSMGMKDLLAKFAAPVTSTPVIEAVAVKVEAVVPDDAPKSNPETNAKPVDGWVASKTKRLKFVDAAPVEPKPVPPVPDEPATTLVEDEEVTGEFEVPSEELAAAQAEAFSPVPAPANSAVKVAQDVPQALEKRPRGRPPGAKNKPKEGEPVKFAGPSDIAVQSTQTTAQPRGFKLTLERITYTHGLTLNTGDYNSARIDVSMTAAIEGNPDEAFAALAQAVKRKVASEASMYDAVIEKGKK